MKHKSLLTGLSMLCIMCLFAVPALAEESDASVQHGAINWHELMTTDVDAALKFYTELFGWETEKQPMENGTQYVVFKVGGKAVGGVMAIPPQAQGVPPAWGMYVTVRDVDASAKQAQELGATLIMPPTDIPGVGRFCVIQDPQGAVISIITYRQHE